MSKVLPLPIEIESERPLTFKWKDKVTTPIGQKVLSHRGSFDPVVDHALKRLIRLTEQLQRDNAKLIKIGQKLADQNEELEQRVIRAEQAHKDRPQPRNTQRNRGKSKR